MFGGVYLGGAYFGPAYWGGAEYTPPDVFSGGNARIGFATDIDQVERIGASRLLGAETAIGISPLDDAQRIGPASADVKTSRVGSVTFTAKKGRIGS